MDHSSYVDSLRSRQKLDRDKGLETVRLILSDCKDEISKLEGNVLELLTSQEGWESAHGALSASVFMIEARVCSNDFYTKLQEVVPGMLDHSEPRVRLSAGDVIGRLCGHLGAQVYLDLQEVLIRGVTTNMERESDASSQPSESEELMGSTMEHIGDGRSLSPTSALVFHDTAGWKALETYMIALQKAVIGCGGNFAPFVTLDLLHLIFNSLGHTNRFVRETGYDTLAAIIKCPDLPEATTSALWPSVAKYLAAGLADNWSQVRMAASVATREFLTKEGAPSSAHLPVLIAPMCLNRYYIAEGVKLYSQDTWKRVTEGRGVALVEQHLGKVVEFYVSQSQAENHAVREAACACIAELGTKISSGYLEPFVGRLITVLLECFQDESWPVRDAACLACGNFVSCFPSECRDHLEVLFPLFLSNLEDSIPSVREGAAIALAQVYTAYGSDVEERLFNTVKERLPQVALQPSQPSSSIDPGPGMFGVVKRVEEGQAGGEDYTHTDQQMYSCGSLAPKMKKGGGGCMQSAFHRPAQPWEKSEGCVHLLAMLSQQPALKGRVEACLPVLAESARARHYPQYLGYLETVLKQLPVVAKSLGKATFKRHLEGFLDPIFHSLSCDSALVKTAGVQCLSMLTQQIGRMIMRGRIEQHDSR